MKMSKLIQQGMLLFVSFLVVIAFISAFLLLNKANDRYERYISLAKEMNKTKLCRISDTDELVTTQIPQIPNVRLKDKELIKVDREHKYKKAYKIAAPLMFTYEDRIDIFNTVLDKFKHKDNINYLEVGVYDGGSLFWVLENILTSQSSKASVVDIFMYKNSKKTYLSNLELSGFKNRVTTIEGMSQVKLREFPINSFDIIYIDGSHFGPDVLEDAILSARLLKVGGVMIFDDYGHGYDSRTAQVAPMADIFYKLYGSKYKVLHRDWVLALEKIKN